MDPNRNEQTTDSEAVAGRDAAMRVDAGEDVFCELGELSVLRAEGSDTVDFLQGQLTCDVAEVGETASRLGAWCNPKGRVAVLFRLLERAGGIDLVLPRALVAETAKRLGMYVMRADVKLAHDEPRRCLWALGDGCARALAARFPTLPDAPNGATNASGAALVRLPGEVPSHLVIAPPATAAEIRDELADIAPAATSEAFELDRIRAAEPAVVAATAGAFVPQMLNLELLGGISFAKGCYIGQEVVARTQHLGKLKRRMYRARVEAGDASVAPGDAVYGGPESGGQSVGTVVRVALAPDGAWELLAVLRIDAAESEALHLHQVLGPRLALLDLPYALTATAGG